MNKLERIKLKMIYRYVVLSIASLILCSTMSAQSFVSHGPIVGGLDEKHRIVFRTVQPGIYNFELDTVPINNNAAAITLPIASSNFPDNFVKLEIENFNFPGKTYHYRISDPNNANDFADYTYKNKPVENEIGNYTFTFGACDRFIFENGEFVDSIYNTIISHQPDYFINLGDWSYPDNTETLPDNTDFFSLDFNRVIESYKLKYSSPFFQNLANSIPVDYVYDDHDFINNNASGTTVSYTESTSDTIIYQEIVYDPLAKTNSIDGYQQLFPGFELPDESQGIYHKFTYGNVEFFILDNRSSRSPNIDPLKNNNGIWEWDPPSGHSILGETQMNWLLDGLQNSTADWKIIGTGTVFNQKYGFYRDSLLAYINADPDGPLANLALEAASAIADSWAGFPSDQELIMETLNNNCIGNTIVISGDSHTGAIDDGRIGGIPELMAASLSQENSNLASIMHAVGIEVWGNGGQGLDNSNDNNVFGKLSTFANDSLKMDLIDEFGALITSYTLPSCDLMEVNLTVDSDSLWIGPSQVSVNVSFEVDHAREPVLYSIDGINYQSNPNFNLTESGTYTLTVKDAKNCCSSISFEVMEVVGLEDELLQPQVSIYPNPTLGNLFIKTNRSGLLNIYNSLGNLLQKKPVQNNALNTIEMNAYPNGIYLVEFIDFSNEIIHLEKVTKW